MEIYPTFPPLTDARSVLREPENMVSMCEYIYGNILLLSLQTREFLYICLIRLILSCHNQKCGWGSCKCVECFGGYYQECGWGSCNSVECLWGHC